MDTSTNFADGDIRSRVPRFEAENLAANQAIVDHVKALAETKGATSGLTCHESAASWRGKRCWNLS